MTEPDFAMGTSLVAGTARGFAPLPAFLLGAEAVPLLWVGDGKVASPSLGGGQVADLRLHAASAAHVTKAAYSWLRTKYVLQSTKEVPELRRTPFWRSSHTGDSQKLNFRVTACSEVQRNPGPPPINIPGQIRSSGVLSR